MIGANNLDAENGQSRAYYQPFDVSRGNQPSTFVPQNFEMRNASPTKQSYGHQPMFSHQLPGQASAPANVDALQVESQTIGIKIPHVLNENCFKKLFPRKVPRTSAQMYCQNCDQSVTSIAKTDCGCGLIACTAGFLCCNVCLFWIPLCIEDCYDIEHICPQCRRQIAQEKFLRS